LCVDDHQRDEFTIAQWLANKTVSNFRRWIDSGSHLALVADRGDRLLGFGLLKLQGEIVLLYVAPEVRFQGVSKALVEALEESAVHAGLREVKLGSSATARRFYASCGFLPTGPPSAGFGITQIYPMSKRLAP
jgi:GNAT superfamily N-acetyltransferase